MTVDSRSTTGEAASQKEIGAVYPRRERCAWTELLVSTPSAGASPPRRTVSSSFGVVCSSALLPHVRSFRFRKRPGIARPDSFTATAPPRSTLVDRNPLFCVSQPLRMTLRFSASRTGARSGEWPGARLSNRKPFSHRRTSAYFRHLRPGGLVRRWSAAALVSPFSSRAPLVSRPTRRVGGRLKLFEVEEDERVR